MSTNATRFQRDFLLRLASLCSQYEATLRYTNNDDGIHIDVAGVEIFVGHLDDRPAEPLLAAASSLAPQSNTEAPCTTSSAE